MARKTELKVGGIKAAGNEVQMSRGCGDDLIDLLNDALDSLNRTAIDLGKVSDISMTSILMLGGIHHHKFNRNSPVTFATGSESATSWPQYRSKIHRGGNSRAHVDRGR